MTTSQPQISRNTFLTTIAAAIAGSRLANANTPSLVDTLMTQIPTWMSAAQVPGCSVAWIQDAQVVWTQGFGVKIAGEGNRVDENTVFESASLTKPIAAYLALKLYESGRLDLDQPVIELLNETITEENTDRLNKITPRHLLSHSSGFPNWRPSGRALRVHHDPGTRFRYSGEGFMVLQKIIERITDQPLDVYAQTNLFDPFGLESASMVWREDYATRMAGGHDPSRNIHGARVKRTKASAASSAICTTADYATFVCKILNPPATDAFHLEQETLDLMLAPQVHVADQIEWGLGWGLQNDNCTSFWHWGNQNEIYHNFIIANRATKSGIVIFTNGRKGRQIYGAAARAAQGENLPALDWIGA